MIASIDLFEALKTRFGEAEAKVIVREIEKIEETVAKKVDRVFEESKNQLSTKEDVYVLKQDILKLQVEIEKGFRENLKWTVGVVMGCAGLVVTLIKFL